MLLKFAPVLLLAAPALAQTPQSAPPTLQEVLKRLGDDALLMQRDLPSIACKEVIVSQYVKKGKVEREVHLTAEVRVRRDSHGDASVESYEFKELDGGPYSGPQPSTPFFVEGAVNESLLYFLPAVQPAIMFTLSPGRLDYAVKPGNVQPTGFFLTPSTRGFVLFDASGSVTHIERTTDPKQARAAHLTDFATYDVAQIELNGKMYPLTTRNIAESKDGKQTRRFDATISGCHLFHATATILPGVTTVPDPPAPPNP